MKLGVLFPDAPEPLAGIDLTGLSADSRQITPGMAFVALSGTVLDGKTFIAAAVAAGAIAVIGEGDRPQDLTETVAYLGVENIRLALAKAAARAAPASPKHIVAVTGTSGKSSVVEFTRQIFAACGHDAASLGTLGVIRAGHASYGTLTTPDPVSLHRSLDALAHDGVTHLAMEASSHGLDQYRLDGVTLAAGAFTNLGHDHLDYHHDSEQYFLAKLRLFTEVLPEGADAVVHSGSDYSARVIDAARQHGLKVTTVGGPDDDLALHSRGIVGFEQVLSVSWLGQNYSVRLPLAGAFQADNALVAAGLALVSGDEPDRVMAALPHLSGVSGRLERVASPPDSLIVIDYAHKPDGLKAVLETLRPACKGRLICVFGCGGDRDRSKRPEMGGIASRLADLVIVTDDNPRSEDPAAIRAAILAAAPKALEIADRQRAIDHAVGLLQAGDVLVVAGKGHETGQIVGAQIRPFSDHEAVAGAVARLRLGGRS
jgi:UDP-N-acetylmuramoyl-L-alanyl-D-glutamate--2,6-diaminopimelate ligase